MAIENQGDILNLPPHTTQLLEPLVVEGFRDIKPSSQKANKNLKLYL